MSVQGRVSVHATIRLVDPIGASSLNGQGAHFAVWAIVLTALVAFFLYELFRTRRVPQPDAASTVADRRFRTVSVCLALFGELLLVGAWFGANYSCNGDGTVVIGSPAVHQSAVCRHLDLPGLPTTPESIILTFAVFAAAWGCVLLAVRLASRWRALGAGLAGLGIGCFGFYVAVAWADVTFSGGL